MPVLAALFAIATLLYALACGLLITCVVLAILCTVKMETRNLLPLWLCSTGLFIVLFAVPKLHYYTAHGIHTKAQAYTETGHWIAAVTFAIGLTIRGKAKWPAIVASALAFGLISAASHL